MPLRQLFAAIVSTVLLSGCYAYTVASTAQTLPKGDRSIGGMAYIIPNVNSGFSERRTLFPMIDFEGRWGLGDRSDIGVRWASFGSVIVNYK